MCNNKYTYLVCFLIFVFGMQTGFSQAYKAGDKAEAFINNAWREVKIVKAISGKNNMYEVQMAAGKNTLQLNKASLRATTAAAIPSSIKTVVNSGNLHLGKYDLYSGIPTMYIGHIVLLADGKYKVAFGTDEDNYEMGNYTFHASSNTIEWQTGLFKNKGWGGKLVARSGNTYRIEFNSSTYAEVN